MGFAIGHCADRNEEVRRYFYDHMFEEQGHEQLMLNDLRAFGVDVVWCNPDSLRSEEHTSELQSH